MAQQFNYQELPFIETDRLCLRLAHPQDVKLMATFRKENTQHLTAWEPSRKPEFYTQGFWEYQLNAAIRDFRHGNSIALVLFDKAQKEIVGVCNFTNIIRGTFQSCHLGYALAASHEGQGKMYEALNVAITYIFEQQRLHRIMANYIPGNERSGKLLAKLGFEIEGRAKQLLLINGQWEDHILTSLINPKHL